MRREGYLWTVPATVVGASSEAIVNLRPSDDADFMEIVGFIGTITSASLTIQIERKSNNKRMAAIATLWANMVGTAVAPAKWHDQGMYPWRVDKGDEITLTLLDTSGAPNTVNLVILSNKVFNS